MDDVVIVGAGIGGLTLGLALQQRGFPCRIFESAAEIRPIGVGINLLPHATKNLLRSDSSSRWQVSRLRPRTRPTSIALAS